MRYVIAFACFIYSSLSLSQGENDLQLSIQNTLNELINQENLLPLTCSLEEIQVNHYEVNILLNIPLEFLENDFSDDIYDQIVEHFAGTLSILSYTNLNIKSRNHDGVFVLLSTWLPENMMMALVPSETKSPAYLRSKDIALRGVLLDNEVQPRGQLGGKVVWLSAGHGWQYDKRRKTFKTQRHNHHGLVEDFASIESVNYHLLQYLYNAGANVWTVRERDMNTNEVIVDNNDGYPDYKEKGSWQTGLRNGYQNKTYRYTISKNNITASATFSPRLPRAGKYWVSVFYQGGDNRSVDTRYKIEHAGGESVVCINQEVHGNTWVYLGQFYFEKGRQAKVTLINESTEIGQAIIADAVRFGGGIGNVPDCYTGKSSGEPRFEEAAKYYAAYQGFPHCMNDVRTRPLYAEWELAKGTPYERHNAVYISWHSNASGSSGTESYVHSFRPTSGSGTLLSFIHDELIRDIRKGWDSQWPDRGKKAADFGELRGLQTMPGVLLEMGFHDNPDDAKALTSPAFRQLLARAVYKGITRYFANKEGRHPVFLPEPPTHLTAQVTGTDEITVNWETPVHGNIYGDAPQEYKVYKSMHGKAFADGMFCQQNNYTFKNLKKGVTYYFRVTAWNEGGESFPTSVVAARISEDDSSLKYLIVDGFDRLERSNGIQVYEQKPHFAPLGTTRRIFLEQMNNYDYMMEHAESLGACGVAFDGASNEAIRDRLLELHDYNGINWFLGVESKNSQTLDFQEQAVLAAYLEQGGNLIISGAELGYDLDYKNGGRTFYRNYLRAIFAGDNAFAGKFVGTSNGMFNRVKGAFNNPAYGFYKVTSPDFIQPINGSELHLNYKNGKGAAIAYKENYGLLYFAFPLESVTDLETRTDLFRNSLHFFHGENIPKTYVLKK